MKNIMFYKMHGLGNDYIYFNGVNETLPINDIITRVSSLSDRNFGIGSDGVVLLLPSENADIKIRMFNNFDGTEAEICGNATRCIAKLSYQLGITTKKLTIETIPGIIHAEIIGNDVRLKMFQLPQVSKEKETIKSLDKMFDFYRVDIGNPHVVIKMSEISNFEVEKYGRIIENNNLLFPSRTNVEFYQEMDADVLSMRVWERGSGETLSCGSGACAVAAVYRYENNNMRNDIIVKMLGGDLKFLWEDDYFYMQGDATFIYDGKVNLNNFNEDMR